jgi:dienelactone hydrolase
VRLAAPVLGATVAAVGAASAGLAHGALGSETRASAHGSVAGGSAPGAPGSGQGERAPLPTSAPRRPSFAVGLRAVRLVDRSRRIRLPAGRWVPRSLLTYVRYPARAGRGGTDLANAEPARAQGPYPLIVFAHGFDVTPAVYARLLRGWAAAGYVVAAPVFPLESPSAPGGPQRSDLVNEPRDVSFVISRLLAASAARSGPLAGLIDPARIAVAGQSDGGEVALAVGYSGRLRDPRVDATVVLSGAEMSGIGGFRFQRGEPPLLAVQGTADPFNEPRFTYAYFADAKRPKYLLQLLGAGHLPPYTDEQPQLRVVERVSTAFLDRRLQPSDAPESLASLGNVRGIATLRAEP